MLIMALQGFGIGIVTVVDDCRAAHLSDLSALVFGTQFGESIAADFDRDPSFHAYGDCGKHVRDIVLA